MTSDTVADTTPPATVTPSAALPESANVIADKKGPGILLRTLKRGDGKRFPKKGDMCLVRL